MLEVYVIKNQINGKIYVGQTSRGTRRRWVQHVSDCHRGLDLYLYRAMRKYGQENFSIEVIDHAQTREELDSLEHFWVEKLGARDSSVGYNMKEGGAGFRGHKFRYNHEITTSEIIRLYRENKSCEQVADILKISSSTVRFRLREANEDIRSPGEAQKIRLANPENCPTYRDDISTDEIVSMYKNGQSMSRIAVALSVSDTCVFRRLREAGETRPPIRCNLNPEEIEKMYLSGYTIKDIARKLEVSYTPVYNVLRDRKTPKRPQGSRPLREEKKSFLEKEKTIYGSPIAN
jgi:group I intron endonuclease